MALSVVLDTNVLIAGLRSSRGASYVILKNIGTGAFELQISVPLVLEYEGVAKDQARALGLTHDDIDKMLDYICAVAKHRTIHYLWRPFLRDPKDDMVLELAVEAEADYILSHNIRDYEGTEKAFGIRAITPREFLNNHRIP